MKKLKKEKLSKERKKELKLREEELNAFGMTVGDISTDRTPNRFYLCFIRALLIFMAVFGMTGGLVSSFDLPFSVIGVAAVVFVLSLFSAFLYYNKISFYIGYVVVFLGFVVFSARGYWYINSGYQAFSNEVFNAYSDYFGLLSVREATEFITDRYLTVTAMMIFMGWFFSIILNIAISGYMSLAATFMITFLPLQAAFYIDRIPPMPYLILLIAAYVSVAILGRAGHFTLPYRHEAAEEFERRRKRKKRGGKQETGFASHSYLASSGGMMRISIYSMLFSTAFMLVTAGLFSSLSSRYVSNRTKDLTDRYIKAAVQGGIYSLFNRYQGTGGLSEGRLGGMGNVSPDFNDDLTLRFVPLSSSTIYLKGYEGAVYTKDRFAPITGKKPDDPMMPYDGIAAKMWIGNIDAGNYDFLPYYSYYSGSRSAASRRGISDEMQVKGKEAYPDTLSMLDPGAYREALENSNSFKSVNEVLYTPFDLKAEFPDNPEVTEEYEDFVYDNYLNVPDEIAGDLDMFLLENGISFNNALYGRGAYESGDLEKEKLDRQYTLAAAADIYKTYVNDFEYTMSPGLTPSDQDTVVYFLTKQKRGFCAHFASSGALLLRRLGIPSRYIEGYAVGFTDIEEGEAADAKVSDYLMGDDIPDLAGVVEVNVTDASAHGWVEIWLDGYGWIPYEMTPPSEEDTAATSLYDFFAGLLYRTGRNTGDNNRGENSRGNVNGESKGNLLNLLDSFSFISGPLAWTVLLFAVIFAALRSYAFIKKSFGIRSKEREGNLGEALLIRYRSAAAGLKRKNITGYDNPTLRDMQGFVDEWISKGEVRVEVSAGRYVNGEYKEYRFRRPARRYSAPEMDKAGTDYLFNTLNKAAYSPMSVSTDDYAGCIKLLKRLKARRKFL